jgi:hypothetical protein
MATGTAPAADAPQVVERTCRDCNEMKPTEAFCRTNSADGPRYLHKCKACRNKQRRGTGLSSSTERERKARVRAAYGHGFVDAAPDPTIPAVLGELLREDRDRWGFDFAATWDENVAFTLARVRRRQDRESWQEAFASTRGAWEAAYNGVDGPGWQLSHALLDGSDADELGEPIAA